ncbi:DUF6701 domain-containing protein [Marinimicrobium sp. ABcell2]|uniref:DUF6701 domain-containing protein n=1 Tax=Marinimicrobium sp. ABcell2 TaxID=3069751 RepID=UPI0027B42FC7|nr:DUF6701 domain-containing protein [Marinimicrobium sp. ABcell2]MDQ2075234.1 PA14 domain-containing protein [Marinimicrobium sp. ABcell2]
MYKPTGGDGPNQLVINDGTATVGSLSLLKPTTDPTLPAEVIITSGSLTINGSLTADGDAATAVINMSGGAGSLRLNGAFTTSAMTLNPGTSSTFIYGGTGTQTALLGVSQINYHHLVFAGSGTKTQTTSATPTITGTTTVNSGVTFNNSQAVNYQGNFINNGTTNANAIHNYQGNFINNGTANANATQNYQGNFVNNGTYNASAGGGQNYRANFTNNGAFSAGAAEHRFNGSGPQQLSGATTFGRLTLNNSTGLTLNSNVLVGDQLGLTQGPIITGSNVLRVQQTGGWSGVSRGSGWVAGNLGLWFPTGWQERTFDIGAPDAYRPLTVTIPNVTSAGFLIARTSQTPGDHPQIASSGLDSNRSVNRWWSLTDEGVAADGMSITFNYLASDIDSGANPQNFSVERFSGGNWIPATVGSRAGTSTEATNVSGFGQFAIAEPAVPSGTQCAVGETLASGLVGEYYNWTGSSPPPPPSGTPDGTRIDGPIDFNWGAGSPGVVGIGADQFSVRWQGFVRVEQSGNYQFQTVSDDGVRLWVNNQLLIERWNDHSAATDTSGNVFLTAGELYPIRLEYYENTGQAVIRLRSAPAGSSFAPIPAGPTPTPGTGLYHCVPDVTPEMVAYYRFDEPSWDGSANQVEDSSGNGRDGTAVGGATTAGASPAIPGNPGTCRYGSFDGDSDYVEVPGLSDYLNGTASLAFWMRTNQVGSDVGWQAPGVTGVEQSAGTDDIFWGWLDASGRIGLSVGNDFDNWKSTSSVNTGSWQHVVLTRDHMAGTFKIYVNGVLENSGSIGTGIIGTAFSSIGRIEDTGASAGNFFEGDLDEVRVYDFVLQDEQVSAIMDETHPCEMFVESYSVVHSGGGITCEAEPITITARDIDGNAIEPPAGTTISLSTDPATGVWPEGNSYTFSGIETFVTLPLQQTTAQTLIIEATDGVASGTSLPLPFAEAGLRFYGNSSLDPIAHQVAAVTDNAPILRAVQTNTDTGACEGRVQGSQTVNLGYECRNPDNCVTGQTLSIGGTAVQANDNDGSAITYAPVTLNFDASGSASIPVHYTDVGQVRLHGQLSLPVDGNNPAVELTGASNEFVVRPHTLFLDAINNDAGAVNPGTTSGGDGFTAAGTPFTARVEVHNADGQVTPNFGREATPEAVALNHTLSYPAGGSAATLGGNNSSNVTDGVVDFSSLVWGEVGSIELQPSLVSGSYLGAGDLPVAPNTSLVGRFYPARYELISHSVVDACSGFSYMNQGGVEVTYLLQAQSAGGGITENYDNTALSYQGTATPVYVAESNNSGDGSSWTARLNVGKDADGTDLPVEWNAGVLAFTDLNGEIARTSVPDGPYEALQLALTLSDLLDERPLSALNMNPGSPGSECADDDSCTAARLGAPLTVRFGRLVMESAYGPETASLPAAVMTQYWDGARFVRAQDDNCTQIMREHIQYPGGDLTDDANRTVTVGGGTSTGEYANLDTAGIRFFAGTAGQTFSAPGVGNAGSFEVSINLGAYPWLRFDWNQDGNHNQLALPPANIGFGSYRGHDRVIYWREVLE